MATLFIEEWGSGSFGSDGMPMDVPKNLIATRTLEVTNSNNRTATDFDQRTKYIVVFSDVDSFVAIGSATVLVDGTQIILPAGTFRSFGLNAQDKRISIIQRS